MFLPYMGLVLLMLCIQIIAQFFHYQSSVIFPSLGCCNHKNELPNKAAATAKKLFSLMVEQYQNKLKVVDHIKVEPEKVSSSIFSLMQTRKEEMIY